jgi:hypothetical protein
VAVVEAEHALVVVGAAVLEGGVRRLHGVAVVAKAAERAQGVFALAVPEMNYYTI